VNLDGNSIRGREGRGERQEGREGRGGEKEEGRGGSNVILRSNNVASFFSRGKGGNMQ